MSAKTLFFLSVFFTAGFTAFAQTNSTKQPAKTNTTTNSKTSTTKSTTKPAEAKPTTINVKNYEVKTEKGISNPNAKPFTFLGSYTMKYDLKEPNGKKSNGTVKYAFDGFKMTMIPAFQTSETQLRSIFDVKENTMTMLITDVKRNKKNGMIMKMPKVTVTNTSLEKPVSAKITKTGAKKMIDGYNCEEYSVITSDSTIGEFWLTKDINISVSESLAYMAAGMKGKPAPFKTSAVDVAGCVIEGDYKMKDGSTIHLKTTEIKKGKPDAAFFSTDGFKLSDVTQIEFFK
jgi:hypothetical protein